MREITNHRVVGNEKSEVVILVGDEPGSGGANHLYRIWANDGFDFMAEINFQNGPIPANGINGVTHEVLLAIVADRLESFQNGPYHCVENASALTYIKDALNLLKRRTEDRIARQVEGQLKI